MTEAELDQLRYPIGHYTPPETITETERNEWISTLGTYPAKLRALVSSLSEAQLDTPYRPGGWTIRQLCHHLPDSHIGCYIRLKWALTEDKPLIKAYDQDSWSALGDSLTGPIEPALLLLEALHQKIVLAVSHLEPEDFRKSFHHPETGTEMFLDWHLGNYAWHGAHHYAQIANAIQRGGWVSGG